MGNETDINIEKLRILCKDETIVMTQHAINRLKERHIRYNDIKSAIMTGEIIEYYPEDYPNPSCLVLGTAPNNTILHVVVGICNDILWIITVYSPTTDKWNNDYKTRRT